VNRAPELYLPPWPDSVQGGGRDVPFGSNTDVKPPYHTML